MVLTRFELGLHPTDSVLIDCESKETHSGSIWAQDVFVTAVIEFTFLSSVQILINRKLTPGKSPHTTPQKLDE